VHYEIQGSGPPLALLHADGSSGLEFEPVLARLQERFSVLVPDLPGCGRSPRRAFSIEYYEENAKAVLDLLKKTHQDAARVIGVGGGGVVGLWMAILAPARIQAVVADSLAEFYDEEDARRDLAAHQNPSPEMVAFFQDMNGEDWRTVIQELDRLFSQMAEEKRSVFDWRLDEVRSPVLLTGSRQDHLISSSGRRLLEVAEQLPTARLILYPSGGHPAMWSNAESFWRDALAFVDAPPAATPSP
jgi:pimeloyl-ACP methyl ester carboxylesterase